MIRPIVSSQPSSAVHFEGMPFKKSLATSLLVGAMTTPLVVHATSPRVEGDVVHLNDPTHSQKQDASSQNTNPKGKKPQEPNAHLNDCQEKSEKSRTQEFGQGLLIGSIFSLLIATRYGMWLQKVLAGSQIAEKENKKK